MPAYGLGDVISSFGAPGTSPHGVEVTSDGCLWHADTATNTIYKLTQSGSVATSFASPSSDPTGVGTDPNGCIWSTDFAGDTVYKQDQSGAVGGSFTRVSPQGIDADAGGSLWIATEDANRVFKATQSGSIISCFFAPSSGPQDLSVGLGGCIWLADDVANAVYKTDGDGVVAVSFSTPGTFPKGVGVESESVLWTTDRAADQIYEHASEPIGLAPASNPTAAASPTATTGSTLAQAVASNPTLGATPTAGEEQTADTGTGTKPTPALTPTTAAASTAVTAAAAKPTATASAPTPKSYADVPLIDGRPIDSDVRQTIRHDEIELEIRADQATLADVLRPVESHAGQVEKLQEPAGGFTHADPTSPDTPTAAPGGEVTVVASPYSVTGTVAVTGTLAVRGGYTETGQNTIRYSPRYAESPVVEPTTTHPDEYAERPVAQAVDAFRVTVRLKIGSNVEPATGLINESGGANDWVFETFAGTIATERVRRDTEAESDGGTLGFVLRAFLSESQAHALRTATGHLASAGTVGSERQDADAVDNSPDKSNSLNLQPRSTEQIDRGHYVLKDVELTRLDPEGTWYEARIELLPNTDPVVGAAKAEMGATPLVATRVLSAAATATKPTVSGTPTGGGASTAATATAAAPTMGATATQAVLSDISQAAAAAKPTMSASAPTATRFVPTPDAHYDATALTGFSDGDSVGTWDDEEGSNNLTQGTGSKQPTYQTNVINGNPIVRFDGSDDLMTASWTNEAQPNTIFVVAQAQTALEDADERVFSGPNGARHILWSETDADGNDWSIYAGSTVQSGTVEDTDAHVFAAVYDGANSLLRLDASQIASGDAGSDAMGGLTLGNDEDEEDAGDFDIGEVRVFWSSLSTSDRDAVESDLANKWGITI